MEFILRVQHHTQQIQQKRIVPLHVQRTQLHEFAAGEQNAVLDVGLPRIHSLVREYLQEGHGEGVPVETHARITLVVATGGRQFYGRIQQTLQLLFRQHWHNPPGV